MPRPTLTVGEVHDLAPGWTLAAIRWRFACWEREGWPRVARVPCRRNGGFRRVVDAADLRALLDGEMTAPAWHALRAMGALPPELADAAPIAA